MVARVAPDINARLVMFTYYNPIMRRGAERFCQQAKAAGASGGHFTREACRRYLSAWFLVAAKWLVGERTPLLGSGSGICWQVAWRQGEHAKRETASSPRTL